MRHVLVASALVILALAGCSDSEGDGGVAVVVKAAFVDALLAETFKEPLANNAVLVIRERMSLGALNADEAGVVSNARIYEPGLVEAFEDLFARNASEGNVTDLGVLKTPHVTLSDADMAGMFAGADDRAAWDAFYAAHPDCGGIITLSRPGFTKDRTKGVIYMGYSCGGLCGRGQLYTLELKDGVWTYRELAFNYGWIS